MSEEVPLHRLRRLPRISCADPHPERSRDHHGRHDVQVHAPCQLVLVVAVVALAVVHLDVPMRTHVTREFPDARVALASEILGRKRRDVPGDLLRRLADLHVELPPVPVALSPPGDLPSPAERADDHRHAGEVRVDWTTRGLSPLPGVDHTGTVPTARSPLSGPHGDLSNRILIDYPTVHQA